MYTYTNILEEIGLWIPFFFRYVDDTALAIPLYFHKYLYIHKYFQLFSLQIIFTIELGGEVLGFLDVTIKIINNTIECD